MVGGRGVRLAPESVVRDAEFFLALDPREDRRGGSARGPSPDRQRRPSPSGSRSSSPRASAASARSGSTTSASGWSASTTLWYRDLLLREDRNAAVDPDEASRTLAEALRRAARRLCPGGRGRRVVAGPLGLPPPRDARAGLARVRRPRPWATWCAEVCAGKRTLEEVRRVPLVPAAEGAAHARPEPATSTSRPPRR